MAGANQSQPLSFGEAAGGLAEQARPASDWFKKKKKEEQEETKEKETEEEDAEMIESGGGGSLRIQTRSNLV